ncbi:uncharacterized protein DUF4129 [Salsuginibacillus halophilus]|uniref:Uncharacterized protein DUF4129 n=1 Tax=Salsuginibacillus halophilus TaxID=517424 RepID=A0A2P8HLA2_9BACI|nr:DUF4129 domain-containing transglutaminase family protein [Salsuginibacillus halophilus]PSL47002.1 uncharacterized protein DUF4129 [Salsuginibacillus halophilus]
MSTRTPKQAVVFMLAFLLLMEWLVPLPAVTDTGFIHIFMIVAAIYFLIMFLQLPNWLTLLLMSGVTLYGLHHIFFHEPFLGAAWWQVVADEFVVNYQLLMNGAFIEVTDFFRSLMLLILLAIMSYLMYFWVIYVQRIFFFLALTVVYVAVMDTFTAYDATGAMVRIVLLGFTLLALLKAYRLTASAAPGERGALLFRWSLGAFVIVAAAVLAGTAAPKAEPQWPDPVPFIESAAGIEGGGGGPGVQRIGYSTEDSRLGGGFEMDDSPVFQAEVEHTEYWRGESLNHYTGHGWEENRTVEEQPDYTLYEDEVDTEAGTAEVQFAENVSYDPWFYPGEFQQVLNSSGEQAEADGFTGELRTQGGGSAPPSYTLGYETASFPIERMQEVTTNESDPAHVTEQFTQVPDTLPDRVADLAEELTEDYDNRYDQARAVEDYLTGQEFVYDTENIPVPGENEDYVDQFLFESQRGYCDNFSTSMAVLLRTLDIPTRWVKGFTPGEEVDYTTETTTREVRNDNAHSWVEVYFPEVGWVPFEPTPGFSDSFSYVYEESGESEEEWEPSEPETPEFPEEDEEEEETEEEDTAEAAGESGGFNWWQPALAALILAGGLIYFRRNLVKLWMRRRYQSPGRGAGFVRSYESLLRLLHLLGWKRGPHETLREYAVRMDEILETDSLRTLTEHYERQFYGRKADEGMPDHIAEAWRDVVGRAGA